MQRDVLSVSSPPPAPLYLLTATQPFQNSHPHTQSRNSALIAVPNSAHEIKPLPAHPGLQAALGKGTLTWEEEAAKLPPSGLPGPSRANA